MRYLARLTCLVMFWSGTATAEDPTVPWITTKQRLTILSANDAVPRDSITVVHLGPDHPPIVKTVFSTVPNTIAGSPYMAMTADGHYGFVTNWLPGKPDDHPGNMISVIDLSSPQLSVLQKVRVPHPQMAVMHPDGKRLIVPCANGFGVFQMRDSRLVSVKDNPATIGGSIDISPSGDRVVATGKSTDGGGALHVFQYDNGVIKHLAEIQVRAGLPAISGPFSPRFTPDGKYVLSPNGKGLGSKGTLDDVLLVDMTITPPTVTNVIPQVADGMESVAVHPQGKLAVVACLDAHRGYCHLAVIDLVASPARLLYHLDIEPIPEGMEFSPDGSKLFVGATTANRIVVFEVDGYMLKRSPFVIRVGHGPSSMAIGPRFMN